MPTSSSNCSAKQSSKDKEYCLILHGSIGFKQIRMKKQKTEILRKRVKVLWTIRIPDLGVLYNKYFGLKAT